MFGMNTSQIAALVERLATVGIASAVGAGYVAKGDEQLIVAAIVGIVSAAVGVWNNRATRLANRSAKANPDTVTVGSETLAANTSAPNIVSSRQYEVTTR